MDAGVVAAFRRYCHNRGYMINKAASYIMCDAVRRNRFILPRAATDKPAAVDGLNMRGVTIHTARAFRAWCARKGYPVHLAFEWLIADTARRNLKLGSVRGITPEPQRPDED